MGLLILWLVIAAAVILVDIFTSSFLFVWFSIGAFAAVIANLVGLSFGWQLLIFGIVSLISISIGYPWTKKKFKQMIRPTPLMEESYIGKVFTAQEDIENSVKFKVGGIYWTGHNEGTTILKGEKFKVTGIEGNKLIIKGLKEK